MKKSIFGFVLVATLVLILNAPPVQAWEPTKAIELVVLASPGGGAGVMASIIPSIAGKYNLSPRPIFVTYKPGGAGGEGLLYTKDKKGDNHTLVIPTWNLFTTPLNTGIPFHWKDLTPISLIALDQFILWVHTGLPYTTAKEYIAAVRQRSGKADMMKMAGTGSSQEDRILTLLLEDRLGVQFIYVPIKGGGEVAINLAGRHVDSTVNNPIEALSVWKADQVRPLAVFDKVRIPDPHWKDIPTVKEALDVDIQYHMLRGIFGTPKMAKDAVDWYVAFFKKVYDTPEFKKYLAEAALKPAFMSGVEFVKYLEENEKLHREAMAKGGLLKKK